MSEIQLPDAGGGSVYSRRDRRTARVMVRNQNITQIREGRIANEADVALLKMQEGSYLTVNAGLAMAKVAGTIKQLEEQSGGDMALAARLHRFADRHEWLMGETLDDFGRDVRRM